MLDQVHQLVLRLMDALLGWVLALPSSLALVIVTLGTALVLLVARRFTTNQDLLGRCSRDRKRLRQLIRGVRRRDDRAVVDGAMAAAWRSIEAGGLGLREADEIQLRRRLGRLIKQRDIARYKATLNAIGVKTLGAELKPLLVALAPIALLATWCLARLGYHPPPAGQDVKVLVYFPQSAAGKLAHIVPAEGISAVDGWVRPIESVPNDGPPYGLATWTLRAGASPQPRQLLVRYEGQTLVRPLLVGQRTYAEPLVMSEDGMLTAEVGMRPVKFLGIVPGLGPLPPWMVAYLVMAIAAVPLLKRILRVY